MPRVSTGNTSEKAFFLTFTEDQFYLTPQGLDMAAFFKNLRTGGTLRNFDGKATGALLDIYGTPVAGKRLSDFLYRTELDQFKIDHGKRESEKRQLERFLALYERLNNYSHLWLNRGWPPIELHLETMSASPPDLSLGRT